ncbi:unnamed protein product, partial [Larinioides sclopetarius]
MQRTCMLLSEGIFVMCGSANCKPDDDAILQSTQIFPKTGEDFLDLVIDESSTIMDLPEMDDNFTDLQLNNAAFMAGYLSKRCIQKLECEQCKVNVCGEKNSLANTGNIFLSIKEFSDSKNALKY